MNRESGIDVYTPPCVKRASGKLLYTEHREPSSLLLLLRRFSHVQLWVIPEMAAHQDPLSLGFSRQEHRSGLPFWDNLKGVGERLKREGIYVYLWLVNVVVQLKPTLHYKTIIH